jgi:hypothetical protein
MGRGGGQEMSASCLQPADNQDSRPDVREHRPLLALAVMLLLAIPGQAQPEDDEKDDAPKPAPIAVVSDDNFDAWIFQNNTNGSGTVRQRLDRLLVLKVESIDRACKLTRAQRKKLLLAGKGDIKSFFVLYDKAKQHFDELKFDQQRLFQVIWKEIQPIQFLWQSGLFDERSILIKSLSNTLTSEQFATYDASARERREYQHRAMIELGVAMLEQNTPLLEAQRRDLIALLAKNTRPLRRGDIYAYYVIMYQMTQLPEEKLKTILDPVQWKTISTQLKQFQPLRQQLKQSGYWPEDDEEDADSTAAEPAAKK